MNSDNDTLKGLVNVMLVMYLPIEELGMRLMIATSFAPVMSAFLLGLFERLTTTYYIVQSTIEKLSTHNIPYTNKSVSCIYYPLSYIFGQFGSNYIDIQRNTCTYTNIKTYIMNKFPDKVEGEEILTEFGELTFDIRKLKSKNVKDTFIDIDNKIYDVYFSIEKVAESTDTKTGSVSQSVNKIRIFGKCPSSVLKNYIAHLSNTVDLNISCKTNTKLITYKLIKSSNGKEKETRWKEHVTKTNKNLSNTIVSSSVQVELLDDIKEFLQREDYYQERGLAYKRGYALYGPPGTGKTSLVKAIAKNYNIPIFIVDLSIISNNAELVRLMSDVNVISAHRKYHIVLFEDIDRSILFSHTYYCRISQDCFLNILDGIDENKGRITFMTSNEIDKVKSIKGLFRPGRIDTQVRITFCTRDQILNITQLYYKNQADFSDIDTQFDNVIVPPAILVQLLLITKDFKTVFKVLNAIRNFTDVNIDDVMAKLKENDALLIGNNEVDVPKNIKYSHIKLRDSKSMEYDKYYIEALKEEETINFMEKDSEYKAARENLTIKKKILEKEEKLLNAEEYKHVNKISVIQELDNMSYSEIKEKFMTDGLLDYTKIYPSKDCSEA